MSVSSTYQSRLFDDFKSCLVMTPHVYIATSTSTVHVTGGFLRFELRRILHSRTECEEGFSTKVRNILVREQTTAV